MKRLTSIRWIKPKKVVNPIKFIPKNDRVFGDLVRDIQALQRRELEFRCFRERYSNVKIKVIHLAEKWALKNK